MKPLLITLFVLVYGIAYGQNNELILIVSDDAGGYVKRARVLVYSADGDYMMVRTNRFGEVHLNTCNTGACLDPGKSYTIEIFKNGKSPVSEGFTTKPQETLVFRKEVTMSDCECSAVKRLISRLYYRI